jgi:RNA polymerase sigma-70 factor (ECF subfamily)
MRQLEKQNIFDALYTEYIDSLYRFCYFRVNSSVVAEDLVQDVFMALWKEISRCHTIEYPKTWLYTSMRNKIIDYYRKKKSVSLDAKMDEHDFEPADTGAPTELMSEIQLLIKHIDSIVEDTDREVLILRYVNDLSIGEIAEVAGLTNNAVTVRIHRAVTKLKELYYAKG